MSNIQQGISNVQVKRMMADAGCQIKPKSESECPNVEF
jgi:hypothetical protein